MTKITFNLPLFNPLNQPPLMLRQHTVPVELKLVAGEHLFTSTPMEIGNFFHFKVFSHITIPYSYDPDMQYVTICGSDDTSNKQLAIHLSLEQHTKLTSSHRLNGTGVAAVAPHMWTDFIDNTPVVKQVIQTAIRGAIDALVVQLLDAGVQGVIQTGPAPIVNPDNYQDYKAMFAPKKADVEQPSLDDIFEIQVIVDSTYAGTITWNQNYSFANIIDSTSDPKPTGYNSWIRLWADKCHGGSTTTHCSSYNYKDGRPGFDCNTSGFVGGHVIPGKKAQKVATGGDAYIFPICPRHNSNDNIYMSSRYNPTGVKLKYRG
ncbi:hypothetical protein V0288_09840 [Pannus brasiliensis CCIBt3594]|uniref:Uncharacterized protein n=1 Tax=Pannus brasiliensis CCIBt3594 TaxID=1427578 RepID=A0AAW9QQQ0_9CHRO